MFTYLPLIAALTFGSAQAVAAETLTEGEMNARLNIIAAQRNSAMDSLVIVQAALAKALDDLKQAHICSDQAQGKKKE